MTGVVRDSFDDILFSVKTEWQLLLQHLDLVLAFSHEVADASQESSLDDIDSDTVRWSVALEELTRSSQEVVQSHTCVLELFAPARGAISTHMRKHSISRKTKQKRAAIEALDLSEFECKSIELFYMQLESSSLMCLQPITIPVCGAHPLDQNGETISMSRMALTL
jgi:hypothetical protein